MRTPNTSATSTIEKARRRLTNGKMEFSWYQEWQECWHWSPNTSGLPLEKLQQALVCMCSQPLLPTIPVKYNGWALAAACIQVRLYPLRPLPLELKRNLEAEKRRRSLVRRYSHVSLDRNRATAMPCLLQLPLLMENPKQLTRLRRGGADRQLLFQRLCSPFAQAFLYGVITPTAAIGFFPHPEESMRALKSFLFQRQFGASTDSTMPSRSDWTMPKKCHRPMHHCPDIENYRSSLWKLFMAFRKDCRNRFKTKKFTMRISYAT